MLLPVQFPFTLLSTIVSPAYSEASPKKICSAINATSSLPAIPQWKQINQSVILRATLSEKIPVVYSCTEQPDTAVVCMGKTMSPPQTSRICWSQSKHFTNLMYASFQGKCISITVWTKVSSLLMKSQHGLRFFTRHPNGCLL